MFSVFGQGERDPRPESRASALEITSADDSEEVKTPSQPERMTKSKSALNLTARMTKRLSNLVATPTTALQDVNTSGELEMTSKAQDMGTRRVQDRPRPLSTSTTIHNLLQPDQQAKQDAGTQDQDAEMEDLVERASGKVDPVIEALYSGVENLVEYSDDEMEGVHQNPPANPEDVRSPSDEGHQ